MLFTYTVLTLASIYFIINYFVSINRVKEMNRKSNVHYTVKTRVYVLFYLSILTLALFGGILFEELF